jgi:hypothetical protein
MHPSNEHIPTDDLRLRIEDLARAGIPQLLIAEIVEIDKDTLTKYYQRELDLANPMAVARVAQTMYQCALNGDMKAATQYLKMKGAKFGWVEKQVIEVGTTPEETKELEERVLMLEQKHTKDY